ncbi:MAG: Crp/Fnr family transcriptional regulator [Saprospiraceae bacterium]
MIKSEQITKLPAFFIEPDLRKEMVTHGRFLMINKGDTIVKEGQYLDFLPIVITGEIRVFQQKEEKEILLYYVREGETCMMSLSSAYFNKTSTSYGVAAVSSEIFVFPTSLTKEWQLKYRSWNDFLIKTFRSRYDELLNAFESVAFDTVEVRLMIYLKKRSLEEKLKKIEISHQNLANELGTNRVVISRILKGFEQKNLLKLYRGYIQLN